jgi:hypothetical protein
MCCFGPAAWYVCSTLTCTLPCLTCISPYHCLGCCPGITYECIGPIFGSLEARVWPYINSITSCLNRFTCPCL